MKPIDCLELYEDAAFYDLEFHTRDHEIPFFRKRARAAGGPVLEVACGTGRITLPIAADGVEVTGLDISAPMIERARAHAAAAGLAVPFHVQDCRDICLETRFAMVFSATNAMQHLHDVESVCAFLASARRVLAPGGTLVIDVFQPSLEKLLRDPQQRYLHKTIATPEGEPIRVEAMSRYHADSQILHFDLFYSRAGALVRTKSVNMRCFFPEELRALCHLSGLRERERFGDYDESVFEAGSRKQLLVLAAGP